MAVLEFGLRCMVSRERASDAEVSAIPDRVIVRDVGHMPGDEQSADEPDVALRGRIGYTLHVLVEYAKALRRVRQSGIIELTASSCGR